MQRFHNVSVNIRPALLDKLTQAFFSGNAPSRVSASQRCSVSKVTAGKVAAALVQSGIMKDKIFSVGSERPCSHLLLHENIGVLIIDFSSPTFKMVISDPYAEFKFSTTYDYDPSIGFEDNIGIFLSRSCLKAKRSGFSFCAITVLYADINTILCFEGSTHNAKMPSISQKDHIESILCEIFNRKPLIHMTVSDSISEAMRFKLHGDICKGISYIFIGRSVSSFHIFQNGSMVVCSPYNILSDSEKKLLSSGNRFTKSDSDTLFIRIANYMDSAFSPSAILIESNSFHPDNETIRLLTRMFSLSGKSLPLIYTKDFYKPLYILGAIRSTLFAVSQKYITSASKQQNIGEAT